MRVVPDFSPPFWLAGGMAQTIWSNYAPRSRSCSELRARATTLTLDTADEIYLRVHWNPQDSLATPTVVIFHGLTGRASSPQVLGLAAKAWQAGFTVVRADLRNALGDTPSIGVGHAGRSEDADAVLAHVASERPSSPIAAIGYSLGGNVLLKALGERLPAAVSVTAAVAISTPIDLDIACEAIDSPANRVFRNYFVRRMKRIVAGRAARHEVYRDVELDDVRTVREFDGRLVAPLCGFDSAEDYYARSSALRVIDGIATPTLLIQSVDDPFIPFAPFESQPVGANSQIELLRTRRGGHCGFWGRPGADGDRFWAEHRAVEYCAAQLGMSG
ncbi:MAG: alpha/beta fold hydrolase [Acidobacteria bacterium]|nr:alpha/beta fold hydrolase [Acidobacteriota bacterium]